MLNWLISDNKTKEFSFKCSGCGKTHRGAPSFSFSRPAETCTIPKTEYDRRVYLTKDLCSIDESSFYIRGKLNIPIRDSDEYFHWGVWVKQTRESFYRYLESYGRDQTGDHSYGWLSADFYLDKRWRARHTDRMLKSDVHWGGAGQQPEIFIFESEDHPLAYDQRNGISWDHAVELTMNTIHPHYEEDEALAS